MKFRRSRDSWQIYDLAKLISPIFSDLQPFPRPAVRLFRVQLFRCIAHRARRKYVRACMSECVRELVHLFARVCTGGETSVRTRRVVYAACAISGVHATPLIYQRKAERALLSPRDASLSPLRRVPKRAILLPRRVPSTRISLCMHAFTGADRSRALACGRFRHEGAAESRPLSHPDRESSGRERCEMLRSANSVGVAECRVRSIRTTASRPYTRNRWQGNNPRKMGLPFRLPVPPVHNGR